MKYLFVINCLGYFNDGVLSFRDLLIFAFISFLLVSVLMSFHKRILLKSKGIVMKQVDVPIYTSKDIFSQEIVGDSNFASAEKGTSVLTKITVFLLSFLIITTSIYKLITNGLIEFVG